MKNEIGLLNNEIKNLIAVGDPASKEAAKSKKKEVELVDTINAMQKVKMPKADGKKKIKENLEEVDPKTPAINTPDEKNIDSGKASPSKP